MVDGARALLCRVVLALFFLAGLVFFSSAQAAEWGVKLQLGDVIYTPGGELDVDVSYYNLTDYTVSGTCPVTGGLGCCYELVIEDPDGNVVTRPAPRPCLQAFSYLKIGPHEVHTLHQRVPLIEGEYASVLETDPSRGKPLPPGTYRLCFRDFYRWLGWPELWNNKGTHFEACVPFTILFK